MVRHKGRRESVEGYMSVPGFRRTKQVEAQVAG